MKIGALKESYEGEARVAVTPSSAAHLKKLGHEVFVESGAGVRAGFSDAAYQAAGVTVEPTAAALINDVDVVVKVRPPELAEIAQMRRGQTLISHFWPAQNAELLEAAREQGITAIAMDMVPRISRAQSLDVLSSMAGLGGYRAVIEAAQRKLAAAHGGLAGGLLRDRLQRRIVLLRVKVARKRSSRGSVVTGT